MLSYAQLPPEVYREVWYFALTSQLSQLDATRTQLQRVGVDVRRIYTFGADSILIPPGITNTRYIQKKVVIW